MVQSRDNLHASCVEAQDLKSSLDEALAECGKVRRRTQHGLRERGVMLSVGVLGVRSQVGNMLAETKRRHEALIDDREGVEKKHQTELDEMMSELKRRQTIITCVSPSSTSCVS